MTKGWYGPSDIRADGLLKMKKLKERDTVITKCPPGKAAGYGEPVFDTPATNRGRGGLIGSEHEISVCLAAIRKGKTRRDKKG